MKEFLKKLGRKLTGRKGIGNTMTVVIIIAVVLLNILAYTVTNAFGLYFYKPEVSDLSISGNTDDLFANAILLISNGTAKALPIPLRSELRAAGIF